MKTILSLVTFLFSLHSFAATVPSAGRVNFIESRGDADYQTLRLHIKAESIGGYISVCSDIPATYKATILQMASLSYTQNLEVTAYTRQVNASDDENSRCLTGLAFQYK